MTTTPVFAVQCPKCRKFMLVEDHDRGRTVACLLCKAPIKVGQNPGRTAAKEKKA